MGDIAAGTLVQHASLGLGKVVAVEPTALHVFFPGAERRFAAKLRWPAARALLRTDDVGRDPWLEGLSAFSLDPAEGRYALAASWITREQAIGRFRREYPKGFADPSYLGGRRARAPAWRAAHAEWAEALGPGEGARLLAEGDLRELVRRAVRIEKHVALVPGTFENGAFGQAFRNPRAAGAFFGALFEALAGPPSRGRQEKLFAAVGALGVDPALAWPLATVFPFVADPTRHVFVWPRTACAAAERLGCDLKWNASPNHATYAAMRAFSAQLLEELRAIGARDFVDVEAFLHSTATAPRTAGAGKAAPSPKRTAPRSASSRRTR